jgi:hypothetical protein
MMEESEKNDDWNWNAQQPQQNSTTHNFLLCSDLAYLPARLDLQLSRIRPPSVAAKLAAKAPISCEAVSSLRTPPYHATAGPIILSFK